MSRRTLAATLALAATVIGAAALLESRTSWADAADASIPPSVPNAPTGASATATPVAAPAAASSDAAAPAGDSPFKNVKVLTDVATKQDMRAIMKAQSAALGVKCSFCHVQGSPESDDKEEKLTARAMMRMVRELNGNFLKEVEDQPAVTCWTCHRGNKQPEREVPQSAFDALEAMAPSAPTGGGAQPK
jgi:hypothetical protein